MKAWPVIVLTIVAVVFARRYYDPEIGMWISPDPMNEFFCPYTYSGNNPIRYTDPLGLLSADEVQKFAEATGTTNIDANLLLLAEHTVGLGTGDVTTGADLRAGLEKAGIAGESIFPISLVKSITTSKEGAVTIAFAKGYESSVEGVGFLKLGTSLSLTMPEQLQFTVESGLSAKPKAWLPWVGVNRLQLTETTLKDNTSAHILNVRTVTLISKDVTLPKAGGQ